MYMLYACYPSAVDSIAVHFTTLGEECSYACLCVTVTLFLRQGRGPRAVVLALTSPTGLILRGCPDPAGVSCRRGSQTGLA